jgi:hypothetical protein
MRGLLMQRMSLLQRRERFGNRGSKVGAVAVGRLGCAP